MLVEFASVVDAMRCATLWQRGMSDRRIEWRIGVNLGDIIIIDDDDIFGDGVNIAARCCGGLDQFRSRVLQ
jgi:class 3 adenylate cyclase